MIKSNSSPAEPRLVWNLQADLGEGPVWVERDAALSPDGTTLYWVDTLAGTISANMINADGSLGETRQVVRIPPVEGHPDGPTVDSEGCIWISLYSGWETRRYSPDGVLLERVR